MATTPSSPTLTMSPTIGSFIHSHGTLTLKAATEDDPSVKNTAIALLGKVTPPLASKPVARKDSIQVQDTSTQGPAHLAAEGKLAPSNVSSTKDNPVNVRQKQPYDGLLMPEPAADDDEEADYRRMVVAQVRRMVPLLISKNWKKIAVFPDDDQE